MASAATQSASVPPHQLSNKTENNTATLNPRKTSLATRDIQGNFNYYKDPGDGSLPLPTYINDPKSYNQNPIEEVEVTIHDIRGREKDFSLDTTGFQIVNHVSKEKDFLDPEQIKRDYYPEVEKLLKDS
jgi:hypothetical protein